jgi:hypothetical protein
MEQVVDVARDYQGIRVAVRELFEEMLFEDDDSAQMKAAEHATNADRLFAEIGRRSLADGYYVRANYLLDLDLMFDIGIRFELSALPATDYHGIRAVRIGKSDFERMHPRCPRCSMNQKANKPDKCWKCGEEFKER